MNRFLALVICIVTIAICLALFVWFFNTVWTSDLPLWLKLFLLK